MREVSDELAEARRVRSSGSIQRVEDDELALRVERSCRESEQSIEEWYDFVDSLNPVAFHARQSTARDPGLHGGATEACILTQAPVLPGASHYEQVSTEAQ